MVHEDGERIWTPWFIKFMHSRCYFNFYTNFPNARALSVSHRDAGVNYGKSAGPDSKPLDESSRDFNIPTMPPLSNLKWHDFCFREVLPGRVVKSMDDLGSVLPSVQRQETVLVASLFGASKAVTRNLLCQFERINSQNHIFGGPHSEFLYDLARRGRPMIDIRAYESLSLQTSTARLTKEVLVKKAGVIIKRVDELNIRMDIGTGSANRSSSAVRKKMVYWSGDNENNFSLGQKRCCWIVFGDISILSNNLDNKTFWVSSLDASISKM
ncbi:hypothetical protein KPL70_002760 [Citrus sinensis]|nr:hypothetical protein KPL70_002760 [Citrus sinensis]GAY50891.1 hypothetical protein CUMW_130110 [Citrus unshiu]